MALFDPPSGPSETDKHPVRLGEYQVRGVIGVGGMGVVYEGYHPAIGKRVAIKVLRRQDPDDPKEAERLLEEARLINLVEHRGLVQVFSAGTTKDGSPYLVMEYLSGMPLSEHVHQQTMLPLSDAVQILDEVLAALAAAHLKGVIHRDLKPSNVFLVVQPDGSTYVKLLDFGLAKRSTWSDGKAGQTSATHVKGTPEYMAPEQIRGQMVGPKTDLYGVGVIAFELLTGRLPFTHDSTAQLLHAHLTQTPVAPSSINPQVPVDVDNLVLGLLAKEESRRPANAEAVRAQLKFIRAEHRFSASTRLLVPPGAAPDAFAALRPASAPPGAAPAAPAAGQAPPRLTQDPSPQTRSGSRGLGAGGLGAPRPAEVPVVRLGAAPPRITADASPQTRPEFKEVKPKPSGRADAVELDDAEATHMVDVAAAVKAAMASAPPAARAGESDATHMIDAAAAVRDAEENHPPVSLAIDGPDSTRMIDAAASVREANARHRAELSSVAEVTMSVMTPQKRRARRKVIGGFSLFLAAMAGLAVFAMRYPDAGVGPAPDRPLEPPREGLPIAVAPPKDEEIPVSNRPPVPSVIVSPLPQSKLPGAAGKTGTPRRRALNLSPKDSLGAALLERLDRVRKAWGHVRKQYSATDAAPFDQVLEYCEDQVQRSEKTEATRCIDEFVRLVLGGREP